MTRRTREGTVNGGQTEPHLRREEASGGGGEQKIDNKARNYFIYLLLFSTIKSCPPTSDGPFQTKPSSSSAISR